jgi:hypothetical protein
MSDREKHVIEIIHDSLIQPPKYLIARSEIVAALYLLAADKLKAAEQMVARATKNPDRD